LRSVGKGSFGDVFLVRRKKDDRQFVLKKMHIGKTEKEREACQLEIKLLERLEHPGIVEYVFSTFIVSHVSV
jgi:NIMA (never in mitosis gene a)-related kinase